MKIAGEVCLNVPDGQWVTWSPEQYRKYQISSTLQHVGQRHHSQKASYLNCYTTNFNQIFIKLWPAIKLSSHPTVLIFTPDCPYLHTRLSLSSHPTVLIFTPDCPCLHTRLSLSSHATVLIFTSDCPWKFRKMSQKYFNSCFADFNKIFMKVMPPQKQLSPLCGQRPSLFAVDSCKLAIMWTEALII